MHMIVEILLSLLYTLVFAWIILKSKFFSLQGISKKAVIGVFLLKITAGVLMFFIYSFYYTDRATADIFKYFDDSKVMYDALFKNPLDYFRMLTGIANDSPYFDQYYQQMNNWYRVFESNIYNDSHTIIRFNAFIRLFSFGYYNVHTVFICFLSLIGQAALYKFFYSFMKDKRRELFFAVFLMPSVVFWGSGVLKEGLLLFAMGMFLYYLGKLLNRKTIIKSIVLIALSTLLLLYTKYYIFIILLPLTLAYVWCRLTRPRLILLKYAVVLLLFALIGLNIHHIFPGYNVLQIIAQKQNDFVGLAIEMKSGSLISERLLQPDLGDMLLSFPTAFYNTLVRPYIFEAKSFIMLFAAAENLMILFLIILTLIFSSRKAFALPEFYLVLMFFTGTFILTGLTTPVIGAMVRYKVPAMPFLMISLLFLINKEKLLKKLPVLKKWLPGDVVSE